MNRGNIQRRSPGSFLIRFEGERINGKRKQRCVTVKGSYKDAQRELARLLAAADAGTLTDPSKETVAVYLRGWLAGTLSLSPKTLERYRELAEIQIIPHLGDVKLQRLTPERLEQWHSKLIESGLSARTVGHAHRVLSRVLRRAVENGTLARNVGAIRKPPKVEQEEIEILTPDQRKAVLDSLQGHNVYLSPPSPSPRVCGGESFSHWSGGISISIVGFSASSGPSKRPRPG